MLLICLSIASVSAFRRSVGIAADTGRGWREAAARVQLAGGGRALSRGRPELPAW
jgi:hypothetical protein